MSEEKSERQFDWEGLRNSLPKIRHKTMVAILPDRDSPRILSDVTPGIYPVIDSLQSAPDTFKNRKKSGLDKSYYLPLYSIPLTPQTKNQMTPQDLTKKLGFDTEAMVQPKNMKDYCALLDEAISLVDGINDMFDAVNKNFCRENFREGEHSFIQYMDKEDNAYIEWVDPEIKKNILDNNLVGVSPWVEIFKIDGSYCNFTNKHGKIVGRIKMKYPSTSTKDTWVFESEPIGGTTWEYVCTKPYPYDCEREVVQWMVKMNLFEAFINYNPE
jgi:hypothetical protein